MSRRFIVEHYDSTAQRVTVHTEWDQAEEARDAFLQLMTLSGYTDKGVDNFIRRHGALLMATCPDVTLVDALHNATISIRTIGE
jgi:hypothetical protein